MNLARTKISLLGLLVMIAGFAIIQSGCEKQQGPEHKVAMTSDELDKTSAEKPIMKDVRAPEDEDVPEPTAVNPSPPTGNDPAPLTKIDRPADDVRFYRIKADDTYWKIAGRELGNPQRWREIKSLNPDVNPSALKIGQSIRIPVR